jgi:putative nucleotidyltransferase with HDIG domain
LAPLPEQRFNGKRWKAIAAQTRFIPPAFELIPRLLMLLEDADVNCEIVADMIKVDVGLTADVLRVANSTAFGTTGSIATLEEAICRVGMKEIIRIVIRLLGTAVLMSETTLGFHRCDLWRHSLAAAIATQVVAKRAGFASPEVAYTTGLLHDVGKVILASATGIQYFTIMERCALSNRIVYCAEREAFDTDHAEIGAELLEHWGFSNELVRAVRSHHSPEVRSNEASLECMVHVGNVIAYRIGEGIGQPIYAKCPTEAFISGAGIAPDELDDCAAEALRLLKEEHDRLW